MTTSRAELAARGRARAWVVSTIVSVVLVGAVVSQLDVTLFVSTVTRADPGFVVGGVVCAFAVNAVMAWRLQVLLGDAGKSAFGRCLNVTILHEVYLTALPARLGEIAYIVLLKRTFRLVVGAGLANLTFQRLCDLAFVAGLLSLGVTALASAGQIGAIYLIPCAAAVLALVVVLRKVDHLASVAAGLMLRVLGRRARWSRRIVWTLLVVRRWFASGLSWSAYARVMLATMIGWTGTLGVMYLSLRAVGVSLSAGQLLSIGAAYYLIGALPLQAVGGFGISEAGLAGLLILAGWEYSEAISIGVATRLLLLFMPFAQVGLWWPAFRLLRTSQ